MKLAPIFLTIHMIVEILKMICKYGGRRYVYDSNPCFHPFL